MGDRPWFCRDDDDWAFIAERLKLTACPHCRAVGNLIRHGCLEGFDDRRPQRKAVRARRVFCSNRHRRAGCGRTVSVWTARRIRRLNLSTGSIWLFLRRAVTGTIAAAIRATDSPLSDRTFRRLWRRFRLARSAIRTALFGRGPPPMNVAEPSVRPADAQVLAHLRTTFPDADCPIAAFQHATGSFFV